MGFTKITNYLLYALMGIAVILSAVFYVKVVSVGDEPTADLLVEGVSGTLLVFTYVLLAIAAVVAVVSSFILLFNNPKALKLAGVVVVAGIILYVISFFLASDAPLNFIREVEGNDSATLKSSGTALILTYLLFGMSVVAILYTEVVSLFKK